MIEALPERVVGVDQAEGAEEVHHAHREQQQEAAPQRDLEPEHGDCHDQKHVDRANQAVGKQLADDELDTEVARSKGIFEEILGQTVRSFAYPYGVHDERVVAAVRRAGYELACTTASGWALAGMDLYRLRRITVFSSDSEAAFARKVAFADNHVGWGKVAKYVARRFFPARWR